MREGERRHVVSPFPTLSLCHSSHIFNSSNMATESQTTARKRAKQVGNPVFSIALPVIHKSWGYLRAEISEIIVKVHQPVNTLRHTATRVILSPFLLNDRCMRMWFLSPLRRGLLQYRCPSEHWATNVFRICGLSANLLWTFRFLRDTPIFKRRNIFWVFQG